MSTPTPPKQATLADSIAALTERHNQLGQAIAQNQTEQLVVQGKIQALQVVQTGAVLSDVKYAPATPAGDDTQAPAAPVPPEDTVCAPPEEE